MKKYQKSVSGLAVGLALTLTACSGDPVGVNSGDELTDAEIQAVFDAFATAVGGIGASAHRVTPPEGIQLAEIKVDQSIDISAPCSLGGNIALKGSVKGTVDDETYDSDIEMGIGIQFNACEVESDPNSVSVDGEIQFESRVLLGEGTVSVNGSQLGGFEFTTADGRIGSCAIDIRFDASYTEGSSAQSNLSGTVCNRSASQFEAYTGS